MNKRKICLLTLSFLNVSISSLAEVALNESLQKKCIEYYNISGKKILPTCKDLINKDGTPKDLEKLRQLEEDKKKKEQELLNKEKSIKYDFENQKKEEEDKKLQEDKKLSSFLESINKYNMVYVEGGAFEMGNSSQDAKKDEKPVHKVEVSNFYIGKYEVTQKEIDSIIGVNNSNFVGPASPVDTMSWNDSIKFCNILNKQELLPISYDSNGNLLDENGNITTDTTKVKGFRLPTEAEWEYAARGGIKSLKYKFSGSNEINDVSWYNENSSQTNIVGKKKANELGLYDMSGNVYEWCNDLYSDSFYSKSENKNPYNYSNGTQRVLRGGSWNFHKGLSTVFSRIKNKPDYKLYDTGLRLVRSAI